MMGHILYIKVIENFLFRSKIIDRRLCSVYSNCVEVIILKLAHLQHILHGKWKELIDNITKIDNYQEKVSTRKLHNLIHSLNKTKDGRKNDKYH